MEKVGYVIFEENNKALIDVRRNTACGDKCSSCGSGCDAPNIRIEANNNIGAKAGEFVEIQMETKTVLGSAFLVYIIPLILLIFGIGLGINVGKYYEVANYELVGLGSGLGFLGISFIILRIVDKIVKNQSNLKADIVKILDM